MGNASAAQRRAVLEAMNTIRRRATVDFLREAIALGAAEDAILPYLATLELEVAILQRDRLAALEAAPRRPVLRLVLPEGGAGSD